MAVSFSVDPERDTPAKLKEYAASYHAPQHKWMFLTGPLNQLIPAWIEALQMMKPGDVWELYVPAKMGYGERGAGQDIPPNSTLIFKIELIDVLPTGNRANG